MTVATTDALEIPAVLKPAKAALDKALGTPLLGAWPEDTTFHSAEQPEAIARALIPVVHNELTNARIAYVFREKMRRRGQVLWGMATKLSTKFQYFAELDFLVEINWTTWSGLSATQRVALLDHELAHCSRGDEEQWILRDHDVHEFNEIIQRWGAWEPALILFVRAMQLDMFPGSPVRGSAEDLANLKRLADAEADETDRELATEQDQLATKRRAKAERT